MITEDDLRMLVSIAPHIRAPSITSKDGKIVDCDPASSKYVKLLTVMESLKKDLRPTYAGNKSSAEKLKRGLISARLLVKECISETEKACRH